MIGVASKLSNQDIVQEFFELFKTEWEFEQPGVHYDLLIRSAGDVGEKSSARLIIFYGADLGEHSWFSNVRTTSRDSRILLFNKDRLPIYGRYLSFPDSAENELVDEFSRESVTRLLTRNKHQTVLWVGYDLWAEIRYLLLNGQPEPYAEIATLDLHIELLRWLLHRYEISYTELPPVPAGFRFIACLTHDVDHASIRAHRIDRTIVGFVYRAAIQSLFHIFTGRKLVTELLRNWAAVISLPFVQLGLLPDIWSEFEKYADIEEGVPSTFFVIPKAGDAGRLRNGSAAPRSRAGRYTLEQISSQLRRLAKSGHEIALHGINAWLNQKEATSECAILQEAVNGADSVPVEGVRMHWLYYDQSSAKALDQAGFHYDSTLGYNRTIGYWSGTSQVYKALGAQRLKELPLHVMDTALCFPDYMNLRPAEAKARIKVLIANARRFGGVLTINWHDRSIAPERLWHRLYSDIIAELKNSGAWFASALQTVQWFEKRRAVSFNSALRATSRPSDNLPGVTTKEHLPRQTAARKSEPVELAAAEP